MRQAMFRIQRLELGAWTLLVFVVWVDPGQKEVWVEVRASPVPPVFRKKRPDC